MLILTVRVMTPLLHSLINRTQCFCWLSVSTWQSVDEPAELLLGDVGPAEVQSCWLSPDDAAQHEGGDGLAAVQVDVLPQPLVAAPGEKHGRYLKMAVAVATCV